MRGFECIIDYEFKKLDICYHLCLTWFERLNVLIRGDQVET